SRRSHDTKRVRIRTAIDHRQAWEFGYTRVIPAICFGAPMRAAPLLASSLLVFQTFVGAAVHADTPQVVVHHARVAEGDSGAVSLYFEVEATGLPRRIAVSYQTHDGTATVADGDYLPGSGVIPLEPSAPNLIGHWGSGIPEPFQLAFTSDGH